MDASDLDRSLETVDLAMFWSDHIVRPLVQAATRGAMSAGAGIPSFAE